MKLRNTAVLETIFTMMGNFAQGKAPAKKVWSGIEVAPFKDNADAAICITADFELSWGWRARGQETSEFKGKSARRNVPLILALLDEYSIPIKREPTIKRKIPEPIWNVVPNTSSDV